MKRILVTGAAGQLGGELAHMLGADAMPIDIDTLNLTDGRAVRRDLADMKPELVINCAAYTNVDRAESEPDVCRAVNAAAVGHLAAACSGLDCPLVQISTDYVFGGPGTVPISAPPKNGTVPLAPEDSPGTVPIFVPPKNGTVPFAPRPHREDDPTSPQGVYARTKLEGELAAAQYAKHLIVRTCGLYARPSHQQAQNFVKTILRFARSRDTLRVVADQHCTPSYVPHVARAVLFLAGVGRSGPAPWGIYHVTNGGATTWYELACEIVRLAGLKVAVEAITTAEYPHAAPRPAYSVLDTSAYHRLGGPVMPDWKTAIAEYFAELKMQQ
ncbi:MAG: SDR family oxidoreductase [Thermoguttaceae bacterium]